MSTLYLTEQGSKLRKTSKRLVVEKGGTTLLEVPAYEVDRVLIFGAVQLSTQAISFLLDSGIEVSFLSMSGRLKGKLTPVQSKNVFLRLAQYDRYKDNEFKLRIARSIIEAKFKNQRTLILRHQRNHPGKEFATELDVIANALSSLPHKKAISSIMGLEGASTGAYFRCYAKMLSQNFAFEKRSRHPPLNPTNALLSLGYVLITNEIAALLESAGFDPFIGFLHGLRYGRRSLSLDLVEEFRHPVVDGLVLTLINTGSVKDAEFHKENNGAVLLNKDALKRFLTLYEERMEKQFLYRDNGTDTSYRKLFRISYDISDDRTRRRVANLLMDYGKRVQYSVFECLLDAKTLETIITLLKPFVDGNDSIRVYQLCESCVKNVVLLGKGELTEVAKFHLV